MLYTLFFYKNIVLPAFFFFYSLLITAVGEVDFDRAIEELVYFIRKLIT